MPEETKELEKFVEFLKAKGEEKLILENAYEQMERDGLRSLFLGHVDSLYCRSSNPREEEYSIAFGVPFIIAHPKEKENEFCEKGTVDGKIYHWMASASLTGNLRPYALQSATAISLKEDVSDAVWKVPGELKEAMALLHTEIDRLKEQGKKPFIEYRLENCLGMDDFFIGKWTLTHDQKDKDRQSKYFSGNVSLWNLYSRQHVPPSEVLSCGPIGGWNASVMWYYRLMSVMDNLSKAGDQHTHNRVSGLD